jgi:hypothetical protein
MEEKKEFASFDDFLKEMEERRKSFWYRISSPFYNAFYFFKDFIHEVSYFFQRVFKGYSRRDVWNLYTFIAEKTLEPLIELRKSIHGIPIGVFESEEEMDKDDSSDVAKRWEGQIDEMIFAFKFAMAIGNEEKYKKYLKEVDMPSSDYDYSSEEERENYRAKYEIANKRAQKGFENLGKYYMCLYD